MDKLVSWNLTGKKSSTCSRCGMAKQRSKGCCKDEQKQYKLETAQKATAAFTVAPLFPGAHPVLFDFHQPDAWSSAVQKFPVSHGPPGNATTAIYIRNRVVLI